MRSEGRAEGGGKEQGNFGFWILDFGLKKNSPSFCSRPKSKIQNLKSQISVAHSVFGPRLAPLGEPQISIPVIGSHGLALFGWVRIRGLKGAWRELVHQPVKLALLAGVWSTLFLGSYLLALHGFLFVYRTAGVFLLDRLWYLLLFVVLIMLAVSQLATAYSTLVRSPETAYWLTLPVSARWMMRAKWIESSCYSAWSVVLLVVPLELAYLHVIGKPWWMIAWMAWLLLPLVGLATCLSTCALLAWLRWLGRRSLVRRELIPVGLLVAWIALFWLLGERGAKQDESVWFAALQEFLPRVRLASSVWMPSAWMARSLAGFLDERWIDAWLFCALLWTSFLTGARLLDHAAAGWLIPMLRRQAGSADRLPGQAVVSDRLRVESWWGRPFPACVVKDIRLLLRDPMQWGQAVVFFGLLGAYFANLHRMGWVPPDASFRIAVASLNLACTLLVFGSLAVRFLFPQMSLEGRRLWIVHVVPGGLRSLLYSKLLFYSLLALAMVTGLLVVSALRLHTPPLVAGWLAVSGGLTSVGLVGLTLGLGAQKIDVYATDPARIVSSSNGATALLLMLIHVGLVAWATVVFWGSCVRHEAAGMWFASGVVVAVNLALGYWPVREGLRRLDQLEL